MSGEAEAVGRRHAEFFLALAEEAEPELSRSQQAEWLDRLGDRARQPQGCALVVARAGD